MGLEAKMGDCKINENLWVLERKLEWKLELKWEKSNFEKKKMKFWKMGFEAKIKHFFLFWFSVKKFKFSQK